jgi:hypothetical protein
MLVEVDDGVMFVDEPNGARAVLRLRDPVANRITSHVRLLNRHYNRDPLKTASAPVSPAMRRPSDGFMEPNPPDASRAELACVAREQERPCALAWTRPTRLFYQRGSLRREGPRFP